MNEPRKSIVIITGVMSIFAIFRLSGILQVKEWAFIPMVIMDSATMSTFIIALLWPWLTYFNGGKHKDKH